MQSTILALTCLFLSSMILVICIFFRPIAASFPVSLTLRQYQKNSTLSPAALLAHCATVSFFSYTHFYSYQSTFRCSADHSTICKRTKRERQKVNLTLNNVSLDTSKHQRALCSVFKHIQSMRPTCCALICTAVVFEAQLKSLRDSFLLTGQQLSYLNYTYLQYIHILYI